MAYQTPLKAVIFDVGGVLVLPKKNSVTKRVRIHRDRGVHEFIAHKLKIPLDQWFDAIDSTYTAAYTGALSEQTTLSTISRNLKIVPSKIRKVVIKAYRKNFKQNKQLYRFAFRLRKDGYKIAILSDQWWLSKEAVIKEKYMKKFNPVIISCDVSMRKPNPEIYKLTLKKLKLKPSECLFIDNQSWNITPAKKLGIKTVLFKDNKQLFKQLLKEGVRV